VPDPVRTPGGRSISDCFRMGSIGCTNDREVTQKAGRGHVACEVLQGRPPCLGRPTDQRGPSPISTGTDDVSRRHRRQHHGWRCWNGKREDDEDCRQSCVTGAAGDGKQRRTLARLSRYFLLGIGAGQAFEERQLEGSRVEGDAGPRCYFLWAPISSVNRLMVCYSFLCY
jgi:hypothetical protein